MSAMPSSIVAVDVETTGLHSKDRIVTLGAWRIRVLDLSRNAFDIECIHIIANPGRKSHPRASEVHGYSDWTLRHQQPFSDHAQVVRDFLLSGEVVVAHNASFDFGFIEREYQQLGQRPLGCRQFCTMNGYRQSGLSGSASLKAICQQMGLERIGKTHGALEDAWMALMVYFWIHKAPSKFIQPFSNFLNRGVPITPSNYKEPPPLSEETQRVYRRVSSDAVSGDELREAGDLKNALLKAARPTAILLLEIARADKAIAAKEVEIVASVVRATCSRLGLPLNEEVVGAVLRELYEINVTQNLLTRSARSICADLVARAEFPKWVAAMAAADGGFSTLERAAVDRVKAAIQRVLPSA